MAAAAERPNILFILADDLGIADNTIVCFTSDNGGVSWGDAFATSNLPLKGGKGLNYEGGIREPFYIRAPGLTRGDWKLIHNHIEDNYELYRLDLDIAEQNDVSAQHPEIVKKIAAIMLKEPPTHPIWRFPCEEKTR
jgi:arylsulfatase A-like enzyme